jgi:hypothetical protein
MKENGAGRRLLIVASFWWVEPLADRVCAFRGHGRTAAEKLDLALAFGWRNTSALRLLLGGAALQRCGNCTFFEYGFSR